MRRRSSRSRSAQQPAALALPPALAELQRQVDDIARRYDSPTPGFAIIRQHKAEPFGGWLLAQRDRGDWIDELAAAARADRGFPKNGSPDEVRNRLAEFGDSRCIRAGRRR